MCQDVHVSERLLMERRLSHLSLSLFLSLSCRFKNGKPHPWSKDVSSFIVYPEAANQTIYSPRLEENDVGNYTCILRNETHIIHHNIELRLQGRCIADQLDSAHKTC